MRATGKREWRSRQYGASWKEARSLLVLIGGWSASPNSEAVREKSKPPGGCDRCRVPGWPEGDGDRDQNTGDKGVAEVIRRLAPGTGELDPRKTCVTSDDSGALEQQREGAGRSLCGGYILSEAGEKHPSRPR